MSRTLKSAVNKWSRKVHRWGAIGVAVPIAVVIGSGLLLQLKKQWGWVQPPTARGEPISPTLSFDQILQIASTVPEAGVRGWDDVDRLDVRPGRGVVKVRCKNRWEIQIDSSSGAVLQSTYRRSDLIESIHDGSWFHDRAKLWLFLPSGVVLGGLWFTGVYLWALPLVMKRRGRLRRSAARAHRDALAREDSSVQGTVR
ncbi:MAG: PepSY domain-containing protein [Planctomycetota bacterium]|jgi:hypothetical protein